MRLLQLSFLLSPGWNFRLLQALFSKIWGFSEFLPIPTCSVMQVYVMCVQFHLIASCSTIYIYTEYNKNFSIHKARWYILIFSRDYRLNKTLQDALWVHYVKFTDYSGLCQEWFWTQALTFSFSMLRNSTLWTAKGNKAKYSCCFLRLGCSINTDPSLDETHCSALTLLGVCVTYR